MSDHGDASQPLRRRRLGLRPPTPRPSPPTPEPTPPSSPTPGPTPPTPPMPPARWRTLWTRLTSPLALTCVGVLLAAGLTFWIAPSQQVRQQQGLDDEQARADASSPSIVIQHQRYGYEVRSAATSRVFSLSQLPQDFKDPYSIPSSERLLPPGENIPPSPLENIVFDRAQPRVYDTVLFTMMGNHYKPVKISDITIQVVRRESPPGGTLVFAAPQGASDVESIGFDLDSPDLNARVTTNDGTKPHSTTAHYFNDRQIVLNRFESIDLKLAIFTSKCLLSLQLRCCGRRWRKV